MSSDPQSQQASAGAAAQPADPNAVAPNPDPTEPAYETDLRKVKRDILLRDGNSKAGREYKRTNKKDGEYYELW